MRPFRPAALPPLYATVLVVTTGVADANWSEFGVADPMRPAQQLVEASCELAVDLHGALAEVTQRQRLTNPGPATLGAMTEFSLPVGAHLVGVAVQRDKKVEAAIPVTEWKRSERVQSEKVLGSDPALVTALVPLDDERPRFRALLQPLEQDQEITLETRWVATADIRDGSLHLTFPGRGSSAPRCKGLVQVKPGPGAGIDRIRLDGVEIGVRATASFELGATDSTLTAVLAFKRNEPLLWQQSMSLGDGYTAQAITIVTPAIRSTSSRRALLVIDGSRSMELVGRHNVQRLVHEIGNALPPKSELEAIIFDRKATRVLGAWKAATPEAITQIQNAVKSHAATNGSDTAGALAFAHQVDVDLRAAGDARGQTMVILISDGVLGDIAPDALTKALAASPNDLDVHAITLAPGRMGAPDAAMLRAPVHYYGGSYIEVATKEIDTALLSIADWLRPAWQGLAVAGSAEAFPDQLRAGTGAVRFAVVKKAGKLQLTGQSDRKFSANAGKAPAAAFAQLALAGAGAFDETTRARLRERHISVDDGHAFAVLTSTGSVAANRRSMVSGGGPYTRMVDVDDPNFPADARTAPPVVIGGSSLDRNLVTILLRQYLQPAAFTCYQRALATNGNLAGTARFRLEIGRGELTRASVVGVGDATFDACLLDAAFNVTPPLPNPDYNTDDRTIVNYPLTFSVREQKPFVVAGDADSSSPIDIDGVVGGIPASGRKKGQIKADDSSTPLGGLRPSATK
jgi:hypothetical protein